MVDVDFNHAAIFAVFNFFIGEAGIDAYAENCRIGLWILGNQPHALFGFKRLDQISVEEFKLAFKSSKKESKHHPKFFQKKVLEEFNQRIKSLEATMKISR